MKLSYCGTTKRLKEFPSKFTDIKAFVNLAGISTYYFTLKSTCQMYRQAGFTGRGGAGNNTTPD